MKLLLTACGCPGACALIHYLRKAYPDIQIIGTDILDDVIGKILADKFYIVPPANDGYSYDSYISRIKEIVQKENIDVILPESTVETLALAKAEDEFKDVTLIVSNYDLLKLVVNKYKLYERLKDIVPLPKYALAEDNLGFFNAMWQIGFPKKVVFKPPYPKKVCYKPPVGEGGRGFEIYMNNRLPSQYPVLVMEYLEGEAIDAMTIALDGEALLTTIKTRERVKGGTITYGRLVDRPEIERKVEKIIKELPLKYMIGLQFLDGKLLEINPRISSYIFQDDLIEPYYAIELARGNIGKREVREARFWQGHDKIRYGRKIIKYFEQVDLDE